jgi:hypothetical protein
MARFPFQAASCSGAVRLMMFTSKPTPAIRRTASRRPFSAAVTMWWGRRAMAPVGADQQLEDLAAAVQRRQLVRGVPSKTG